MLFILVYPRKKSDKKLMVTEDFGTGREAVSMFPVSSFEFKGSSSPDSLPIQTSTADLSWPILIPTEHPRDEDCRRRVTRPTSSSKLSCCAGEAPFDFAPSLSAVSDLGFVRRGVTTQPLQDSPSQRIDLKPIQLQRQRTSVSALHERLVHILKHGVGKATGRVVQAHEGPNLARAEGESTGVDGGKFLAYRRELDLIVAPGQRLVGSGCAEA